MYCIVERLLQDTLLTPLSHMAPSPLPLSAIMGKQVPATQREERAREWYGRYGMSSLPPIT